MKQKPPFNYPQVFIQNYPHHSFITRVSGSCRPDHFLGSLARLTPPTEPFFTWTQKIFSQLSA